MINRYPSSFTGLSMRFYRSCLGATLLLLLAGVPLATSSTQASPQLAQASLSPDLQKVDALNAQGKTLLAAGKFEEALPLFQNASEIAAKQKDRYGARQRGDLEGLANALNGMGSVLESLGQYEDAEEWYERLKKLAQDRGDRPWLSTALKGLVQVARSSGYLERTQSTIEYYEQVLTYTRQLNDQAGEAETLQALGYAYKLLGELEKSSDAYARSLKLYETLKNPLGMAIALEGLGSNDSAVKRSSQAIERYRQALELRQQGSDRPALAETLVELGKAYTANGQPTQAIALHQESLLLAQELKDPVLVTNALTHLGGAQLRAEKYGEAVTTLQSAIKNLESLRANLADTNKISIFERQKVAYSYLQQALIAQNQIEAALEVAERSRARAFVDLLAKGLKPKDLVAISPTPPTIAQIKQIAREQKATLVEYSTLEDQKVLIWVVNPSGQVSLRQSNLQNLGVVLNTLVADSRAAMGVRLRLAFNERAVETVKPIRTVNESLQQWHELLIDPIADLLPTDPNAQVVFIPQDGLFFVPFAAFQDKENRYLIEKHTIRTAPSIQVLALTRQQRQRLAGNSNGPVLLVGNPDMPSLRPPRGGAKVKLASLPGAEDEAKQISALLKVKPLLGKEAGISKVMEQLPKARLVHLATHGLLDFKDGGIPGAIALYPDKRTTATAYKAGLLTARDLADPKLKLQAELVVLSACDTGRGRVTGDGVIGLTRSLIAAGSPSVIASLWAVPDAPTAALMVSFYKNLQRNPDKAQALRQAMLETIKSYPDPLSWAAFVLLGEA